MLTPKDLADDPLASEAEHKRRATALRRLANGVQSQTAGALGLADKERKTLADAVRLLEAMAEVRKQAAALAKQRGLARAAREKALRAAVKVNFARLNSVEDQVALITMVNREVLTGATAGANKLQRLRAEFDEALDGLVQLLARGTDKRPETLVAEAWSRFEQTRAASQAKHRALIDALRR